MPVRCRITLLPIDLFIDSSIHLSFSMTLQPSETQLLGALRHADRIRQTMSIDQPAAWRDYVESLRGVSLANWSATTDLQMKFGLLRTVINEIR